MNLSNGWVAFLAEAGIESIHWSSIGNGNAPDIEIMNYARTNRYCVLTRDLDFGAMLAATQGEKPSIIQIRADRGTPEAIGPALLMAIRQSEVELEQGVLITIEPERTRFRCLPLRS